ncbi:MAG: shikimate kinase [Pseudomonadota bacterium]
MQLKRWIALVGMMGCGKSSVGAGIARVLNTKWVDSDVEIEKAAMMTISEIFERDGEAFFRKKESQIIERLLDGTPQVLSTGGGAFLSSHNRSLLNKRSFTVFLDADADTLWARVANKDDRPLLQTNNPRQKLDNLLAERLPLYRQAQATVLSGKGASVGSVVDEIVQLATAHGALIE